MDVCAPFLVTTIEDTFVANCIASLQLHPSDNLNASPAVNASPAAVVSIAFTFLDGNIWYSFSVTSIAPFSPNVTTTFSTPLSISVLQLIQFAVLYWLVFLLIFVILFHSALI